MGMHLEGTMYLDIGIRSWHFIDQSICMFKRTMEGQADVQNWFATTRTNLVAKTDLTEKAGNYKFIACQSIKVNGGKKRV